MQKTDRTYQWIYGIIALLSFLYILLGEGTIGHVMGGDSETYYIQFRHHIGVAPLYPLFIHVLKLVVGEALYLDIAAFLQIIFLVCAVVYLVYTISSRMELKIWEIIAVWLAAMLPFPLLLPEDPIGHTIMTESVTYPLTYFVIALLVKALFDRERRYFVKALILIIVASLVRSQMMFLFAVLGGVCFYVLLQKMMEKKITGKAFFGQLSVWFVVVLLAMKSVSWMATVYEKVFFDAPNVAYSDQTLVQHMLYLADEEDAELFADEEIKEIFRRCYMEMEALESNHKHQPDGLMAWREIVRDCGTNSYMLTDVIEGYLGPQGKIKEDYIEKEMQIAQISHELAYPLLKAHLTDKLKEAVTLMIPGFISTVAFHKESIYGLIHIATFLFYLAAIGLSGWCLFKDKKNKKVAEFMVLVLVTSVINVTACNLVHFGLQRYLAYTLGMNWMGMFLLFSRMILPYGKSLIVKVTGKKNERKA